MQEGWESLLIKEEAKIRVHISNEHKLKLYLEQMEDTIETLEKENKSLLLQIEKTKNLEEEIKRYENRINILNQLIKDYEERERKILDKKIRINLINVKEEGGAAAPCLKDEGFINSCISTIKISESCKKIPSLQKEIKYLSPIAHQKLKSKKISHKVHTMHSISSMNTKKNDSFSKTKNNDEAKSSTIDMDNKYSNSTIYISKNYSMYSSTIKNNIQKKKNKDSLNNAKIEASTNSNLNNSQLYQNKNIKLYNKLDIYKKLLNKKIRNITRNNKNKGYKSNRNNSVLISSRRKKINCNNHSLKKIYNSSNNIKKNNNISNTLKDITIKVLGKNKNKIIYEKNLSRIKQKILNKNNDISNVGHLLNNLKRKKISNNINSNLPKLNNESFLKNFFYHKINDVNSRRNKLLNSKRNNSKNK